MKKIAFQKIDLVSFSKIFLGVALIVLSVVILRSGQGGNIIKTSKVGAVDSTNNDYKTVWTGSKLLLMTVNKGKFAPRKIALGPSEWTVKMSQKDGTIYNDIYEETWTAPIAGNITYDRTLACNPKPFCQVANLDATKWLFSSASVDGDPDDTVTAVTFSSVATSTLLPAGFVNILNESQKVGNGGYMNGTEQQSVNGSCNEYSWCIYPTGGYGWNAHINDNSSENSLGNFGVMMPLEWTVYGKIL